MSEREIGRERERDERETRERRERVERERGREGGREGGRGRVRESESVVYYELHMYKSAVDQAFC